MTRAQEMLQTHPSPAAVDASALGERIEACFDCAQNCAACADACRLCGDECEQHGQHGM